MMVRWIALVTALAVLAGCGGDRGLRRLDTNLAGPDEFAVEPGLPLELPSTNALPEPTPGGTNRADRNPDAEAAAALGGNYAAAFAGGIPARDSALVAAVSRNGVDPSIRQTLAREDAAFRGRSPLNYFNWLGRDRYFRAYSGQALDAAAELARFRSAGIETPTAPPQGE